MQKLSDTAKQMSLDWHAMLTHCILAILFRVILLNKADLNSAGLFGR